MNTPNPVEDPEVTAAFARLAAAEQSAHSRGRFRLRVWHIIALFAGFTALPYVAAVALR